jgi:ADP-L-glycero-D-manno-heptose 6-epimerase
VVVADLLGSGDKWRNLAAGQLHDIVRPNKLFEWLDHHANKVSTIVHMGAISSTTEVDVDRFVANNIRLTLDLWSWCASNAVRLIYASSAATYGDGSAGFSDDQSPTALASLRPLNAYGWSKHVVDRRVVDDVVGGRTIPPQWAGLKFFNVYGANETHKGDMQSVVSKIYPLVKGGQTVRLFKSHNPHYPDGGQLRDFVYVRDCVATVRWLLQNPKVSGLFNVGTGVARSFLDLVNAIGAAVGRVPNIQFIDTPAELRDKYQYFTQAEMAKLRAAGFDQPFHSLEEGVRDYVQSAR